MRAIDSLAIDARIALLKARVRSLELDFDRAIRFEERHALVTLIGEAQDALRAAIAQRNTELARVLPPHQRVRLRPATQKKTRPQPPGVPVTTHSTVAPPVGYLALSMPQPSRTVVEEAVEYVTVWTPHRDAPSLIGTYTRKDARGLR